MAEQGRLTHLEASVLERVSKRMPSGACVVALSGGADSAAVAWALVEAGRPVRGVFVDHGWPASSRLGAAAASIGAMLGIEVERRNAFVAQGPSSEERARIARYGELEEAAGADEWIVTGHTGDDQAETVLAHLLRGAGAGGLAGIPRRRGRVVRPQLDVTRTETRLLAGRLGLPFFDDPENESPDLRRNLLRHDVIPRLEEAFNPGLRKVLARTADALADDDRLLDRAASAVPILDVGGGVKVPAALLTTLPMPVASRAIRAALRRVGDAYPGRAADVEAVLRVAAGGTRADVGGGASVIREGPWVVIGAAAVRLVDGTVPVDVPGTIDLPGVRLRAWVEPAPPALRPIGRSTAVLDGDVVGDLILRGVEAGEGIEMKAGTKRVAEALAEAGIPARLRRGWPVVAARGRLAWIAGARVAEWARPDPSTRRFLWLAAEVNER